MLKPRGRVITDYDEEIDDLAAKCEELQLSTRKERETVLQLKGVVSERDAEIKDLEALVYLKGSSHRALVAGAGDVGEVLGVEGGRGWGGTAFYTAAIKWNAWLQNMRE